MRRKKTIETGRRLYGKTFFRPYTTDDDDKESRSEVSIYKDILDALYDRRNRSGRRRKRRSNFWFWRT